ncbi:MAG TPA: hypothetical protein DDY37_03790 [Legionella sp.]|nr:hypothetical protein [Legionella sp.]
MQKDAFISLLSDHLDALEALDDSQQMLALDVISELRACLPSDIHEQKKTLVITKVQELIIYHASLPLETILDQILSELNRQPHAEYVIQPTSLYAALYYLNDMIAASTAMSKGTEESIVPDDENIRVMIELLEYINRPGSEAIALIHHYRRMKLDRVERLVPLLFDIIETAYARLKGWKIENIIQKQRAVDRFYTTDAETCMAKGTLWILRKLQDLPPLICDALSGILLEPSLMKELQEHGLKSIDAIELESHERRYRGGNSAKAWLSLRSAVHIEPIVLLPAPRLASNTLSLFSHETDTPIESAEINSLSSCNC